MRTSTLSFILISIWVFVTLIVPLSVLWEPFSGAVRVGSLYASFDENETEWSGTGVSLASEPSRVGSGSLRFDWINGADRVIYAPKLEKGVRPSTVIFEAYLDVCEPDGQAGGIKPILFFKNKDGDWYQAFGLPLISGRWQAYRFDVTSNSLELQPVHQGGAWNGRSKHECDIWGIGFASSELKTAVIYVDNVRFTRERRRRSARIYGFEQGPETLNAYELYEASFEIDPIPDNPFDPQDADVTAEFICPDGSLCYANAFYYRPFSRKIQGVVEVLSPNGVALWKVRFTPTQPGKYSYTISGEVMGHSLKAGPFKFSVSPSKYLGFIRVSRKDPCYFKYENSGMYYPIGHNLRSPTDARTALLLNIPASPDRGTFYYDDILPKMAKSGENLLEVWMASWFTEIEWTKRWKNYHGLGDYNLANAWKLDYVIEASRAFNMRINLVIDNHGKYSNWCDDEWKHSPYNTENGGFLTSPLQFWSDKRAMKHHKNKLRYIIARWGYSPTIMGFELVSELDLTGVRAGDYKRADIRRWHSEMARYIKKLDTNKHLITTHYSQTFKAIDTRMISQGCIEYIVGDAYRSGGQGNIASLLTASENSIISPTSSDIRRNKESRYEKPYFITEYGGSPWGNTTKALQTDLHCGIWANYMTRLAGTPLFWWFDLIDREDWYYHFKALAAFDKGEDRIGKRMKRTPVKVNISSRRGAMFAYSLRNKNEGYAWIYDYAILRGFKKRLTKKWEGVSVSISKMENGTYKYEIWDTYEGKIIKKGESVIDKGNLVIPLPEFSADIALKFRIVKPGEEGRR